MGSVKIILRNYGYNSVWQVEWPKHRAVEPWKHKVPQWFARWLDRMYAKHGV